METDVSPSRLEATKLALRHFVAEDRVGRIGIVIFAQQGKQVARLDSRSDQVQQAIASLRIGDIADLGTGLGDGLAVAVDAVRTGDSKQQAVILISDGDNNWALHFDPEQAIAAAKAVGVVVHTVVIGAEPAGVTATVNPTLMEHIASATGGTFHRAPDASALANALDDIQTKLQPVAAGVRSR